MIVTKSTAMKPLFESREGPHLSAYLTNHHNANDMKNQLRELIETSHRLLKPVMSQEVFDQFIQPVRNLTINPRLVLSMNGNVGLFRNEHVFRIIRIPSEVERTCVIASSFHIKPLLSWMQMDREFLLLGIDSEKASLYQGSKNCWQLIDRVVLRNHISVNALEGSYQFLKSHRFAEMQTRNSLKWVAEWISEVTKGSSLPLYVASNPKWFDELTQNCMYHNVIRHPIWPSYSDAQLPDILTKVRAAVKSESEKRIQEALAQFHKADASNAVQRNIFKIAKAAIRGQVQKLVVAESVCIFGKMNRMSGGLAIHPDQIDHEDDDLLDDLAQEVLLQGGEVIVAKRKDIPKERPILAILKPTKAFDRFVFVDSDIDFKRRVV